MRVLDHSFGIASSGLVVALSGISGPTRTDFTGSLGTERKRAEPGQKHIRGGKQHSIQEITTRNRLEETEELIVIRALTHREVLSPCPSFFHNGQGRNRDQGSRSVHIASHRSFMAR